MAQKIKGKQIAEGADGIKTANLQDGVLAASVAGRAKIASGFFDAATVTDKFANTSIADTKLVESYIKADGTRAFTADQSMGTNKLTGLADGTDPADAVNKSQLDNAISGTNWKEPVTVTALIGERTIAQINALTPASGDAVVATDAGTPSAGASDALAAGDLAEYNGTSWIKIVSNAAGQLPAGIRAILSTTQALTSPFVDATDDGRIVVSVADPGAFDGSNSDWNDTGDAVDGNAVLVQGPETNDAESVRENIGYVFDGAVATGSWIQFTGAGQLNAGTGLAKVGNTINVGDVNRGIQANADDLELDASEVASAAGGLQQNVTNSWQLDVKPDVTTGGDTAPVTVGANGVGLDVTSLDGDHLTVDFTPTNYTPDASPGEAADVDDLAAHLKGIDDALVSVSTPSANNKNQNPSATAGDEQTTGLTITSTPNGYVKVEVNGVGIQVGNGVKTLDAYFSADGGTTARAVGAIAAGDTLYWNDSIAGYSLEASDVVDMFYNA